MLFLSVLIYVNFLDMNNKFLHVSHIRIALKTKNLTKQKLKLVTESELLFKKDYDVLL